MKKSEIDYEKFYHLSLDLTQTIKELCKIIPDDKQVLLKHLASASIHAAIFTRDILCHKEGKKYVPDGFSEQFFADSCGCKEIIKKATNEMH